MNSERVGAVEFMGRSRSVRLLPFNMRYEIADEFVRRLDASEKPCPKEAGEQTCKTMRYRMGLLQWLAVAILVRKAIRLLEIWSRERRLAGVGT